MGVENPQGKQTSDTVKSEGSQNLTVAEASNGPRKEPVEHIIAEESEELEALWESIPDDIKNSPDFFDLSEGYKGNIRAYVETQREWYRNQGVDQYSGDVRIKEKLQRLRKRVVSTLGEAESKKIVAESQARQREETRKQSDAQTAENIQQIHKELGIGEKEKSENFFDRLKRDYDISDVKSMQQALLAFEEYRKKENAQYGVDENQFYQYLTSGELSDSIESPTAKAMEAEKDANPKNYEDLLLGFYGTWIENMKANKNRVLGQRPGLDKLYELMETLPKPKSSEELRDLYRKYPALNEMSAVSYQDGLGEEGMRNNPFLHFHSHRKDGYTYESAKTEVRLYLNPPKEILPQLAMKFVELAQSEKVPYYFKMVDFSLQRPTKYDARRLDRMVFYADKNGGKKIADLLQKISDENPDWLKGRPLPPLVVEAASGVGVASEPSEYQNQKFSRPGEKNTSFNAIRAKFLRDVWRDATKDVLIQNPDIKPRGGRTLREIFDDLIPADEKQHTKQLWQSGFDESKSDDHRKDVIKSATLRFMADVLPFIKPESLMPYIHEAIGRKAKEYGVNPENLAFNL